LGKTVWLAAKAGAAITLAVTVIGPRARAQAAPASGPLSLVEAVRQALRQNPSVAAFEYGAGAARSQIGVAQVAFLPNAGVTGQFDRGTDNAALGLSFASPLPAISGTVPVSDYSWRSAWTSAAGAYFAWEFLDFGRRAANVRYYQALASEAADASELARLDVAAHAADGFLTVLAGEQQANVARADVARWQTAARIIEALVQQQLRPGADASRAQAELAGARIRLAQAERNVELARAALAEALGVSAPLPPLAGGGLLGAAPPAAPPGDVAAHPRARAEAQAVAAAGARASELERAGLPRWYLLASLYGRGTGVRAPGNLASGLAGLAPTGAGNYAAGAGIDFSFTRWLQSRREAAAARLLARQQAARYRQIVLQLAAAQTRAQADLRAALAVARESPAELAAARTGEAQARVRYQAGLAGVVDWANAEQLLAQAENDAALSDLQVWRGLLETAYANGDLAPFLAAAGGR